MFKQIGAIDLQFELEPPDEGFPPAKTDCRPLPPPARKPREVRVANCVIGRICGQKPVKGESAKTRCHAIHLAFIKAHHEQGHPGGFAPNRRHFEAQGYGWSEWAFERAVRWNDRALDLSRQRVGKYAAEAALPPTGRRYVTMPVTALRLPSRVFAMAALARLIPRPRTPAEIGRSLGIADRHTAIQIAREAASTGLVAFLEGVRGKSWIGRPGSFSPAVEIRQMPEGRDLSKNHPSKNHLSKNHGTQSYRKISNFPEGKASEAESAPLKAPRQGAEKVMRRGSPPNRRTKLKRQAERALAMGADPIVVRELASPLAGLRGGGDVVDWLCEVSSCIAESGPFSEDDIASGAATARRVALVWRPSPQECALALKRVRDKRNAGFFDIDAIARYAWSVTNQIKEGSVARTMRLGQELATRRDTRIEEADRLDREAREADGIRWEHHA